MIKFYIFIFKEIIFADYFFVLFYCMVLKPYLDLKNPNPKFGVFLFQKINYTLKIWRRKLNFI